MSNILSVEQAAAKLLAAQDVLILMHRHPDGDAVGSAFAMRRGLEKLGKRVRVACSDPVPEKYGYITEHFAPDADFEPAFVLAVDLAARSLFGGLAEWAERVDLCIDHHGSNEQYARDLLLDADAASCCDVIAKVLDAMGADIDEVTANCLYTGLATDTGCFRYSNTTAESHLLAARLMGLGAQTEKLNIILFETVSRQRLQLEQLALAGMEYAAGGRIAMITISKEMLLAAGCTDEDVEGITPIPRKVAGVEAGVTVREIGEDHYKVSLRTKTVDASKICAAFGGGGHARAAGFSCTGKQFDIKVALIALLEKEL